jgi:acetyl-CoA synthetase
MNTNIGSLCTSQQCASGNANKVALRLIAPDLSKLDYTFAQLDAESNKFANALQNLGICKGEKVFIFLPKQTEVFFAFLGVLKHQAVAGVLFSNFGKEAVFDRLLDSAAKVLITKQSFYDRISEMLPNLPALEKIILTDLPGHQDDRVLSYEQLVAGASPEYTVADTDPETPSVLHYTSGSTGRPKGVLHVHGGFTHHLKTMDEVFQVAPEDIYWCTADQAWVTGVTYGIIGPWAKGITQIHFTGKFDAVDWFEILQREKVTIWYTAPTALRMLIQDEARIIGKYDLPDLKRVYSVGEPLNPEILFWVRRVMRREIYDTWFQTETGGVMIANRPGLEIKPGSMGKPLDGIKAIAAGEKGEELGPEQIGSLRVKKGWPSMFRMYLNMEEQYREKFHGDFYDTGDLAKVDADGYFWFLGRNDDVINTSGHLVGPFEVESVLLEMEEIIDVAVIGAPDDMLFEKIVAFVKLKEGLVWSKGFEVKCRIAVSKQVSPIAVPSEFVVTDKIPKNRSGKIMRRVIKAQYLGKDLGDISTMED